MKSQRRFARTRRTSNTNNFINNIPNKIIDYLSFGIPIITPLDGEVADLIERHEVGVMYGRENYASLFECLVAICGNHTKVRQMSLNAKKTYDEYYSGDKVYLSLVKKLESIPNRQTLHE